MLTLADELALVALKPDGRAWVDNFELECGLAGAILAELALAQKIGLRGRALTVLDPTPGGHLGIDAVLAQMVSEGVERKPNWWVARLRSRELRVGVCESLVSQGLVTDQTPTVVGIPTISVYPQANGQPKAEMVNRLEAALRGQGCPDRTAVLIGLLGAGGSLFLAFPGADPRMVQAIVGGYLARWAVKDVVDSIIVGTSATIAKISWKRTHHNWQT